MRIIIFGLAGAGKDTVAGMLQNLLGGEITRYAKMLKTVAKEIFPSDFDTREGKIREEFIPKEKLLQVVENYLPLILGGTAKVGVAKALTKLVFENFEVEDNLMPQGSEKHYKLTPRKFQQLFGTEVVRKMDEGAWVALTKTETEDPSKLFIIADGRTVNEMLEDDDNTKLLYVFRKNTLEERTELEKHSSEKVGLDLYNLAVIADTGKYIEYEGREFYVVDNLDDMYELSMNVVDLVTEEQLDAYSE